VNCTGIETRYGNDEFNGGGCELDALNLAGIVGAAVLFIVLCGLAIRNELRKRKTQPVPAGGRDGKPLLAAAAAGPSLTYAASTRSVLARPTVDDIRIVDIL